MGGPKNMSKLLYNTWLYKQPKRKKKKRNRATKRSQLKNFAKELNNNLPKSEVWFQTIYKHFKHVHDQFNVPMCGYIPDVINKQYKYIIEIDGSIHDLPEVQEKDRKKEKLYQRLGYTVFRVKAYDNASLKECLDSVLTRRKHGKTKVEIFEKGELIFTYELTT